MHREVVQIAARSTCEREEFLMIAGGANRVHECGRRREKFVKDLVKGLMRSLGLDTALNAPQLDDARFQDLSFERRQIVEGVKPFTMATDERIVSLINAVDYISENKLVGDIAECGVWRGGSMMAVALALLARGDVTRELWLYDTFEGMSEPTDYDRTFDGRTARSELERTPPATGIWCHATVEEVERNIFSTDYPHDKIHFVKGKVEQTLPSRMPSRLSLLRLDTDWYESTKHELIHLFPVLEIGGILILDDYGHWQGARKAVDEFFQERGEIPYLHRVDYTCRTAVKTHG